MQVKQIISQSTMSTAYSKCLLNVSTYSQYFKNVPLLNVSKLVCFLTEELSNYYFHFSLFSSFDWKFCH